MLKDVLVPDLGAHESSVVAALHRLDRDRIISRIWEKDHTVWKSDPTEICDRLGWLSVADEMQSRAASLQAFGESIKQSDYTDVVLLGMGGSSLGPEVLRTTFGSARGFPKLWVLDSVVPGAVRAVTKSIRPAKTLCILASKSGGTIEVMSLYAHFRKVLTSTRGNTGAAQFVAITDPGTSLAALAHERGFRTTFINPPDIGGRYSVLSYFGLVPAALLGLDVNTMLARAQEMARTCRPSTTVDQNPGAYLGSAMGTLARTGRDKVTILASPKLASFGLWAEQLLAESTGKEGRGLIPVAQEPLAPTARYGDDRLFVYVRLNGDANSQLDRHLQQLTRVGHPVIRLTLRDRYDLAAQFFCWEFATSVAGHYLGINPYDQPNVQESKVNTARILTRVQRTGKAPRPSQEGSAETVLRNVAPGYYVAILAYLAPSATADTVLKALRRVILTRYRVATTAGYGPRYLHSTGQLHKGGPNTGRFLLLVESMTPDLPIPGASYSFGTLAMSQAIGDLESLRTHDRVVAYLDLGRQPVARLRRLLRSVKTPRPQPPRSRRRR